MSAQQLSEIYILLNAAWWKKPRRTRNRIMNGKYDKTYRGISKFRDRMAMEVAGRSGWIWNDPRYIMCREWNPPPNSYDIPVADESGKTK